MAQPTAPYMPVHDLENQMPVDTRRRLALQALAEGLDIGRLLYVRTAMGMPGLAQRVIDAELEWKA